MIDQSGSGMGSGWMHQVTDRAQGVVRSARDSGGAVLDRAGESAGRVADQVGDMFERHPLLIGAIGMLAGGLLAALLPSSRVEDHACFRAVPMSHGRHIHKCRQMSVAYRLLGSERPLASRWR